MRSKYCFSACFRSSAVFCVDSVYPRANPEHPEDLFTLYVMRVQKRKVGEPSGSSESSRADLPSYARFCILPAHKKSGGSNVVKKPEGVQFSPQSTEGV